MSHRTKMSDQDRKLLWGKAGNRCAICRKFLVNIEDNDERGIITGIEAHIVGNSEDGPRGRDELPLSERHKYENIILLCSEHAKTIDERPDVWTKEKLLQAKKRHEQLIMHIKPIIEHASPILRLVQPVGYSGNSHGHFQSVRLKNFDKEPALDINCWMAGFGFFQQLSSQSTGVFLEPGEHKDYHFQLDGLKITHKDVALLYFYASYSNLQGQKLLYKSSLKQKTVASGAFKTIELGEEHIYSKYSKVEVDYMRVLDQRGDYEEAEYEEKSHKFKIKVSRTLLSCWGLTSYEDIQYCFLELGRANVKVMSTLEVFQDKEYTTTSFPENGSEGMERFVDALRHIESGRY